MHPAFSVIFLTTLIGAGQGLFLALYTGQFYSTVQVLPSQSSQTFYGIGSLVALALLGAGLFASFFHLGHPERAWRSAAMWRTSWLSREVIVLPLFMALVTAYGAIHYFGWDYNIATLGAIRVTPSLILGFVTTFVCVLLYVCTGMIYACIRFIQEWSTPLTLANFLLLGSASGLTLATAFSAVIHSDLTVFFALWAIIFTSVAMGFRVMSLIRNSQIKHKSSAQTAIGIRHGNIQQKAQGSMGGSFNTREFFHGKSKVFVSNIRMIALSLTFVLPIILLILASREGSLLFSLAAFVVQYIGLLAERWLFFAQANHPQNIYYQAIS